MHTNPTKNINIERLSSIETFPLLKSIKAITKLNSAQETLMIGEERPLPGGFAKGVGKASPEIPFTK